MVQKIVVVGHSGLAAVLGCQQAQLIAAPDDMSLRDAVSAAVADGTQPAGVGLVFPWDIIENSGGVAQQLMSLQYRVVVVVDDPAVDMSAFGAVPVAGPDSTVDSLAALLSQVMGVVVFDAEVGPVAPQPQPQQYEQPQPQFQPDPFSQPAPPQPQYEQAQYEQPQPQYVADPYAAQQAPQFDPPSFNEPVIAEPEEDLPWNEAPSEPQPQMQYEQAQYEPAQYEPAQYETVQPEPVQQQQAQFDPNQYPQPQADPFAPPMPPAAQIPEVTSDPFAAQPQPVDPFAPPAAPQYPEAPQAQAPQADPFAQPAPQPQASDPFAPPAQPQQDPFAVPQPQFGETQPVPPQEVPQYEAPNYEAPPSDPFTFPAPAQQQADPFAPPTQPQQQYEQQQYEQPVQPPQPQADPFGPPPGQMQPDPYAQPQPQPVQPVQQPAPLMPPPVAPPMQPDPFAQPPAPVTPSAPPQYQQEQYQQEQYQQDPYAQPPGQQQGQPPVGDPYGTPPQPNQFATPPAPQYQQDPFAQLPVPAHPDPFAVPARPTPPPVPQDPFAQSQQPMQPTGHGPSTDFSQSMPTQHRLKKAQVHTFAVPKGGTGKSSLAAIYSAVMSQGLRMGLDDDEPGPRVLLIDANVQQADSRRIMGLRPQRTILDLARTVFDENTIESYLTPPSPANPMWLLAGPINKAEADPQLITPALYRRVTDLLLPRFDHIIIDTPEARLYDPMLADYAMPITDWLIVPVLQNRPVLDGTKEWLQLIQAPRHVGGYAFDPSKVRLVMNMVREAIGYKPETLSVDLAAWEFAGLVAYSDEVARATNEYRLPLNDKPLVDSVRSVLYSVTGNPVFSPVESDGGKAKRGKSKGGKNAAGNVGGFIKKMMS
jgi:cellulose biosynthesis protein BcsQ